METSITFDKLPEAVTYLTALVTSLLGELRELRNALSPPHKSRLNSYPLKRRAHCSESVRTLFIIRRERRCPGLQESRRQRLALYPKRAARLYGIGQNRNLKRKAYDEMVVEMNKGLRPGGRNKSCRLRVRNLHLSLPLDKAIDLSVNPTGSGFHQHLSFKNSENHQEVNDCYGFPIDYVGAAMLVAVSVAVGNTHLARMKEGWDESAILYMALIGRPGATRVIR